jgi:DNA-binding GntR family transcriptional regulator
LREEPVTVARKTLRQAAYQHIQQKIASGNLSAGSVVSELSLAREIGMSRTPVREAIRQLQIEGVVEQVPRYGTIVRKPQRREIAELFQLREALESYAASLAAEHTAAADLVLLRKLCDQIRLVGRELEVSGKPSLDTEMMRKFLAADMAFHTMLIRAAGNARIMKIINDTHVLTRIFGVERQKHDTKIVSEAYQVHCQILDAVERGNPESARQLMARHIRGSMKQTLDHYDRVLAETEGYRSPSLTLPDEVLEELSRIEGDLETKSDD